MNLSTYQHLVRGLCEHVGIADWQAVLDSRQVEVQGRPVGLFYDEDLSPGTISVCLDLGELPEGGLAMHLLEENAVQTARSEGNGYFGIHPDTGGIIYRDLIRIDEPGLQGSALVDAIGTLVAAGTKRFELVTQARAAERVRIKAELGLTATN